MPPEDISIGSVGKSIETNNICITKSAIDRTKSMLMTLSFSIAAQGYIIHLGVFGWSSMVGSWLKVAFYKPRTRSNFLKCKIYHRSNKNIKRQKKAQAVNQLLNIPLIKLIDSIYCLSFTSLRLHYCYWLLSVWNDIFLCAPLATADYNYLQRDQKSPGLEVGVSAEQRYSIFFLSQLWWLLTDQ